MKIVSTQYTLTNKAFEIYFSGCRGNCKGCHNPELKDFNLGEQVTQDKIYKLIKKIDTNDKLVDKIWLLGGEPLDQDIEQLMNLIVMFKMYLRKEIWVFTRYELNQVPDSIKRYVDYIKCGAYIEELKTEDNTQHGIKLATSNQKIYKKGLDY